MKKILFGFIFAIIIAVAVGAFYLFNNLDYLIKMVIEEQGSKATQTTVKVDAVKSDLINGAIGIHDLTVANPKSFEFPYAFSLKEISTKINLNSLKEEPYIIDEITIRAIQVFMEVNKDKKTNLNEIKKNLSTGSTSETNKNTQKSNNNKNEPKLIIRRILFENGNIGVKLTPLNNKKYDLKLPTFKMINLGGEKGLTPTQLTKAILSGLSEQALDAIKKNGIDLELDKLKAKVNTKVEEEKAKINEKTDAKKAQLKSEVDAKSDEEKNKVKDKLKGLFNK